MCVGNVIHDRSKGILCWIFGRLLGPCEEVWSCFGCICDLEELVDAFLGRIRFSYLNCLQEHLQQTLSHTHAHTHFNHIHLTKEDRGRSRDKGGEKGVNTKRERRTLYPWLGGCARLMCPSHMHATMRAPAGAWVM